LNNLLLPHIRDRVVSVSSQPHRLGKPHLEDLTGQNTPYKSLNAYYDSKLNVVLSSCSTMPSTVPCRRFSP
jgi:hypothetical protein